MKFVAWRTWKLHLWQQIDGKVKRYARCRNCAELLMVEDEHGNENVSVLEQHIGHLLDEVRSVNLREWARIKVSA